MDIEKAIEYLENSKCGQNQGEDYQERHGKALDMAIQALEKRTPKKPIKNGLLPNNRYKYLCPTCNRLYWDKEFLSDYCSSCGQKFDLGLEE